MIFLALGIGDAPLETAFLPAAGGEGEVFFQLHIRGSAHHGVLEHAADEVGALMLGQGGDILPVEDDAPLVHGPDARDSVEHGGLARPVAADNGDEVAGSEMQVQAVKRLFLVDRAGVKGLGNVL